MSGLRIGALFAGYGGLDMAVQTVIGGDIAWFSEFDKDASKILAYHWPDVPNHGDITRIDWSQVEPVDVLTGGSPCPDLSHAGKRGGMTEGTRSNLWVAMREAIAQLHPRLVVWENVQGALSAKATSNVESREGLLGTGRPGPYLRAAGRVLGDLAELGYDSRVCGLRASDVGAPHERFRVFACATRHADQFGRERAGSARGRRDGPADGSVTPTDADHAGLEGTEPTGGRHLPPWGAPADAAGDGRDERRPEPTRIVGRPDAAISGAVAPNASGERHGRRENSRSVGRMDVEDAGETRQRERARTVVGNRNAETPTDTGSTTPTNLRWDVYEPMIRRWEHILGRPAPAPAVPGRTGQPRLSPVFVEWLMGLPEGHVTDPAIGISRNAQIKALGNGVVLQQATAAVTHLLEPAVTP